MKKLLILILAAALIGCTENQRASRFGGSQNIELPANQKLEAVTWKLSKSDSSLWYLTRPMREGEVAETWTFQEKSDFGFLEGKVLIKENKN